MIVGRAGQSARVVTPLLLYREEISQKTLFHRGNREGEPITH
jgi:hypothetical protein